MYLHNTYCVSGPELGTYYPTPTPLPREQRSHFKNVLSTYLQREESLETTENKTTLALMIWKIQLVLLLPMFSFGGSNFTVKCYRYKMGLCKKRSGPQIKKNKKLYLVNFQVRTSRSLLGGDGCAPCDISLTYPPARWIPTMEATLGSLPHAALLGNAKYCSSCTRGWEISLRNKVMEQNKVGVSPLPTILFFYY